jgi:rSAM/selenodomain-associated transferase 2
MTQPHPRLAVVIPTLDEEPALPRTLDLARRLGDDVIVTDGGSHDRTRGLARAMAAHVVEGDRGRGPQLDRGARAAIDRGADALLFLHADTALPEDAGEAVRAAVVAGCVGGGFRLAFDAPQLRLRLAARTINLRTALTRTPLGDQAQFATRAAFAAVDGFRSWPILEDLDFAWRLRRQGRLAILRGPATTSARRFLARGVARTVATNWLIWTLFFCGVAPARLARLYAHVR